MSTVLILSGALVVGLIGGLRIYFKIRKEINSRDKLIKGGNKIEVPFAECDVKSRESNDVKVDGDEARTRAESIDGLLSREIAPTAASWVSIIVFKKPSNPGKIIEYRSDLIEMPVETLRFRLEEKASTYIYVDPANEYNYYFDLRFLYNA